MKAFFKSSQSTTGMSGGKNELSDPETGDMSISEIYGGPEVASEFHGGMHQNYDAVSFVETKSPDSDTGSRSRSKSGDSVDSRRSVTPNDDQFVKIQRGSFLNQSSSTRQNRRQLSRSQSIITPRSNSSRAKRPSVLRSASITLGDIRDEPLISKVDETSSFYDSISFAQNNITVLTNRLTDYEEIDQDIEIELDRKTRDLKVNQLLDDLNNNTDISIRTKSLLDKLDIDNIIFKESSLTPQVQQEARVQKALINKLQRKFEALENEYESFRKKYSSSEAADMATAADKHVDSVAASSVTIESKQKNKQSNREDSDMIESSNEYTLMLASANLEDEYTADTEELKTDRMSSLGMISQRSLSRKLSTIDETSSDRSSRTPSMRQSVKISSGNEVASDSLQLEDKTFFGAVSAVQSKIAEIISATGEITEFQTYGGVSSNFDENAFNGTEKDVGVGTLIRLTNATILQSKIALEGIETDTEALKKNAQNSYEHQEVRVRQTLLKKLNRKYQSAVSDYDNVAKLHTGPVGDRLKELQRKANIFPELVEKSREMQDNSSVIRNNLSETNLDALENGKVLGDGYQELTGKEGHTDTMKEFFKDVESVQNVIICVKEATKRIGEIDMAVMQATTAEQEHSISHELAQLVIQTNQKAGFAKQMLQAMRELNNHMKIDMEANKLSPEIRIRENLTQTLTRKLIEVMKDYQNAQSKYKVDIKKKVKRQVQILKPDVTCEEVDMIIKSDGGAESIFKSVILKGDPSDSIKAACVNVADKYQDILALEQSVAELHQMFLDFATIVDMQGEMLDRIEEQIKQASEYVEESNELLQEAVKLKKRSVTFKRKLVCCVVIFSIVIIAVLVGNFI